MEKKEYGKNGERYCTKCEIEMKIIDGLFICDECGAVGDPVMVSEWIDDIWMNRKKSVYIRSRHRRKRLEKYIHHSHISYVFKDFLSVVRIMFIHNLMNKNVSRYDYYIIRLSGRIGAISIKKPKDLVHRKNQKNVQ